jgi:hypothetical protein
MPAPGAVPGKTIPGDAGAGFHRSVPRLRAGRIGRGARTRLPAGAAWAARRGRAPSQPKRDWLPIVTLAVAGLPGLAALIALLFTYQSVNAPNGQLRIAEQGQITDRYNAAITNLGSRSIDVRLGGIYALQRLMKDSPPDQPTVIAVLCAFVRDHPVPAGRPTKPPFPGPPTDIQAALTVVGTRNTAQDGQTTVDFDGAQLVFAQLSALHLSRADFSKADLGATNLRGADLTGADLTGADLAGADLTGADLTGAHLFGARLIEAKWPKNLPAPDGWVRGPDGRLRPAP